MFVKRSFRKNPVTSTVVTAASLNVLIGVLEGQALLAFFGMLVVSSAIASKGWQNYRRRPIDYPGAAPIKYLPEQSARPAMPPLGLSSRQAPPER